MAMATVTVSGITQAASMDHWSQVTHAGSTQTFFKMGLFTLQSQSEMLDLLLLQEIGQLYCKKVKVKLHL
jgi:hypothetical protein